MTPLLLNEVDALKKLSYSRLSEAIESRGRTDIAEENIGGFSVAVMQSGQLIYKNHFGEAISDSTLFRLASMTKPITSVATMILVDRGILSLEDTVDSFYPSFKNMMVRADSGELFTTDKKITVKSILTHSSGIGSGAVWTQSVKAATPEDISTVEAFVDFLSRQPLSFVPDTKQEYSGIGSFSVLTGIIQKASGMPYNEFLKKEIFSPCNMTDTTFTPTAEQWSRLIGMHDRIDGKNAEGKTYEGCVFEYIPNANYLGGAGLIASMSDYMKFATMLMNGGTYEGRRIISGSVASELCRPQFPKYGKEWWGLGVRVIAENTSTLPQGCYGWSGAYGTHFWIDPVNEIIGIYMKNSRYDGGSGAKTSRNFEIDVYSSFAEE